MEDAENQKHHVAAVAHSGDINKQKTAAMLSIFSVFLLVEGVVRVLSNTQPGAAGWDGDSNVFPPVVLLISAIGEVVFATTGLWVGLGVLVFDVEHKMFTLLALACELVFGWFVYAVYTIADPAFQQARNATPIPEFNRNQSNTAQVFGYIFASMSYCAIMQGAQVFFTIQLWNIQRDKAEIYDRSYTTKRMFLYNFWVFLAGVSIIILGALLRDHVGAMRYFPPFVYPPNVVSYAAMTITTGCLELVYAFLGVAMVFAGKSLFKLYLVYAVVLWLWLLGGHVLGQIGVLPIAGQVAGPGVQIVCLQTSLVLAPAYFASELVRN